MVAPVFGGGRRPGGPDAPIRTALDRLFDVLENEGELPAFWGAGPSTAYPSLNLIEEPERYVILAETPGLRLEDLEITCQDRTLALRGRRADPEAESEAYLRRERRAGTFARSLTLPAEVDAGGIQATLQDGLLEISVPKAAGGKPRRIEIRTGSPAKKE